LGEITHDLNILKLFLNHTKDANYGNIEGRTLLHHAAWNNHTEAMQLLIDKGADVVLDVLYNDIPLIFAAEKGYVEAVKLLLENKANVSHVENDSWTSLHFAANNGYANVVEALLEAGARFSMETNDRKTALRLAEQCDNAACVALIKEVSGNRTIIGS